MDYGLIYGSALFTMPDIVYYLLLFDTSKVEVLIEGLDDGALLGEISDPQDANQIAAYFHPTSDGTTYPSCKMKFKSERLKNEVCISFENFNPETGQIEINFYVGQKLLDYFKQYYPTDKGYDLYNMYLGEILSRAFRLNEQRCINIFVDELNRYIETPSEETRMFTRFGANINFEEIVHKLNTVRAVKFANNLKNFKEKNE